METRNLIAEQSYNELLDLLLWFHHQGPTPTIIGGWAVYIYNPYLGSVDIDLVGPSMGGLFDATLEAFERERGYQPVITGPLYLSTSFRKPIIKEGQTVGYMEIDACTYENDPRVFHEDQTKELPYNLCMRPELATKITLDRNCEAQIPNKSLLFLYKLKALRDRQHDLATKAGILSTERIAWLRSKIIKDASDLISLLDPLPPTNIVKQDINPDTFKALIREHSLGFCLDSIKTLPLMETACLQYRDIASSKVQSWITDLLSKL